MNPDNCPQANAPAYLPVSLWQMQPLSRGFVEA
jgi:hypothetical protein